MKVKLREELIVFIASPGDVKERQVVSEVCEELNNDTLIRPYNITLQLTGWKDAFPSPGPPQEIINKLIEDCDLFVCIFHKRFGTPSGKEESGTLEEFLLAYDLWKSLKKPHIMLYFKEITVTSSKEYRDPQIKKVFQLRDKVENDRLLLFDTFDSSDAFRNKFVKHIKGWIVARSNISTKEKPRGVSKTWPINEQFSRLIPIMKPTQRMIDALGPNINSAMAIDDSLLFVRSDLQSGWGTEQIDLFFDPPIQLSNELQQIAKRHRNRLSYPNKAKLMMTSLTPPIIDKTDGSTFVKIHLAPITYFDVHGVELGLDEPLNRCGQLESTLRQLYFKAHAFFSEHNILPNKIVIHLIIITKDHKFLIMQRSPYVEFQNAQWSATFEEQMQGEYLNKETGVLELGDKDFFSVAIRGIREELGVMANKQAIRFLGICSEYDNLAYNVIGTTTLDLDSVEVVTAWKLNAQDKAEHSQIIPLPFEEDYILQLLQREQFTELEYGIRDELWHPTSRMRILLAALHLFQ